jgi:hypothetical protein
MVAQLLFQVPAGERWIDRNWLAVLPHNKTTLTVDDRRAEVTVDLIRLINCDLTVAEPT